MPVDRLSVSKLSTYLRCPRQFQFRYIDKLPRETRSSAASLGTAVHTAIAWWQREHLEGRNPSPADAAMLFGADWTSEWAPGDLDLKGQTADDWRQLGARLVELFITEVGVVPESVDTRFEVPMTLGDYDLPVPLVGYYDYLVGDVIGEIKTTARRSSPSQWWLQLAGYSYAHRQLGGRSPTMQLVVLVKKQHPEVAVIEHQVSEEDVGRFLAVAAGVFQAVEENVFFPNPSWACAGCEFRAACHRLTMKPLKEVA